MEVVFDFGINACLATVQDNSGVSQFLSDITPNNFLSLLDFLRDAGYVALDDFSEDVDYSVAEY